MGVKTVKRNGVHYVVKPEEQILVEELLEKLESKGVLKKADVKDIKLKAKSKASGKR